MVRKILILLALSLSVCTMSYAQPFQTTVDVLKGEKWWGIFIGGDRQMPLDAPFERIDLSTWTRRQTTPLLLSSRGRYIWSNEPFTIEFTGESFVIESDNEKIQAITAGKTLREAYLVCCHKNFPQKGNIPSMELFRQPIYDLRAELGFAPAEDTVESFVSRIIEAGYPAGTFVFPAGWQSEVGSYSMNNGRYGDHGGFIKVLHDKGFKVMLTVTPFVSGDGETYRSLLNNKNAVVRVDGKPAMVEWNGGYSAFYDITDDGVFKMVKDKLDSLRHVYGVDGFLYDCRDVLPYVRYSKGGVSEYLQRWSMLSEGDNFAQYTISRGCGFAPYIHNLNSGRDFDWDFLRRSVADMISANLLGYPFVTMNSNSTRMSDISEADPKLILRYMQLSSVFPVMNITFAPWSIKDDSVARSCAMLAGAREKLVEYYSQTLNESIRTAEPIIRHMEYEFPRNGFTDCDDQFMIGSKILIAPLLGESDSRTVRFPRGVWMDAQGKRYKGPLVTTVTSSNDMLLFFEAVK